MKKLTLALVTLIAFLAVATSAKASEGQITLSGSGVSCKATSVWHESRYRVIGRCDGLVYPYQTQYEYYTIWAHDISRDAYVRVDDIDRGYFEGDMTNSFDKMLITAEQDGGPRRPSTYTIASGSIDRFTFDKSQKTVSENTSTGTTSTTGTTTVQNNTTAKTTTTSTSGSVVGRIITSLLVIILVVVGVVIAGSLLFRSRGSVSA